MLGMQNLEIQFNTEVIKKVKSYHFQVDQLGSVLFILFALYEERTDLLDEFDDYNKAKRALVLYKEMELRSLIEETDNEELLYRLTPKGTELVEFIKGEFSQSNDSLTTEKIATVGVENLQEAVKDDSNVEEWIDEWVELFPKGVRSGGKLLRSDKISCGRKMKVFMREYKYDHKTIMDATKAYLKAKAEDNWAYTRCAVYFIYRTEDGTKASRTSDLASWCENLKEDNSSNNTRESNFEIML